MSTLKKHTETQMTKTSKEVGSITCKVTPVFPDNFEEELIQATSNE